MEIKPAIVVVAYNREDSLKRLLQSINNAYFSYEDITLIISIDYSDMNESILKIANSFVWKYGQKKVIDHSENLGLRKHILKCGDLSEEYGAVIILEDDLVVAPDFYNYAKSAQEFYSDDEHIAGVALYSHEWNGYIRRRFSPLEKGEDVYFGQFSVTWGQCWTANQWRNFKQWYNYHQKLEFQINMPRNIWNWSVHSWGKYFVYYMLDTNKFYVIPYRAMTTCFSEAGTHIKNITLDNQVSLFWGIKKYKFIDFENGIHYDIFFENIDLIDSLKKYTDNSDKVCVDLYGKKGSLVKKYDYILTTRKMNGKLLKSFGLQMRPWEMNIIYDIPGDDIYLYYHNGKYDKDKRISSFNILNYEAQGMPWQDACKYGLFRAAIGFKLLLQQKLKR